MAFVANIVYDQQQVKKGVCALSEHMLCLFKRALFKKLVLLATIHQLRFISLQSIDQKTIVIKTKHHTVMIETDCAMNFGRVLLRNYLFSTISLPEKKKMKIIAHDESQFPPFFPDMSPSQMIQFSYYSYCTMQHYVYSQHVVKLFHKFISTGNSIIDFSMLPLLAFDLSFSKNIQLRPIFSAIKYSPFITGIQCSNVNRPDFLKSVAALFQDNPYISIFSLTNCNIANGAKEFGLAIEKNKSLNLRYLDLSDNKIEDISFLASSLGNIVSQLFYLNLNNIYMGLETTKTLFTSIKKNPNLHNLTHLLINNSTINKEVIVILKSHLSTLNKASSNKNLFTHLDLGCIASGAKRFFKCLANYKVPLESLKIAGSKLDEVAIEHLLIFLSNSACLQELDISDMRLKMKQIAQIINSIQSNDNIKTITMHFNGSKLNGNRLIKFIAIFNNLTPLKFIGLGLENNEIKIEELHDLIKLFHKMINLQWLNLSNNFYNSKSTDLEITNLLSIPRLDFLALRGTNKRAISKASIQLFMETLLHSDRQIALDLRYNYFSDKTLRSICKILEKNKFTELHIDGSRPRKSSTLVQICKAVIQSDSIISFNYPINDIYNLMSTVKKKNFKRTMLKLETYRVNSLLHVMTNQAKNGYHSSLSFKRIPQLDQLIDESVIQMNNILFNIKPNHHSSKAQIIGLPLPFQKDGQGPRIGGPEEEWNESDHSNDMYGSHGSIIIEDSDNNSLQYNSLCIRRPGATMSFQIPESINELINQANIAHSEAYSDKNSMYDLNDEQECSISREQILDDDSDTHSFIRLDQDRFYEEEEEYFQYSE